MHKKMKINLSAKFALISMISILPLMLATISFQAWLLKNNTKENSSLVTKLFNNETADKKSLLSNNLKANGKTLLTFLAQLGPEKIMLFDYDSLNQYVDEVKKNPEVMEVIYYDAEENPITSEAEVNLDDAIELSEALIDISSGDTLGSVKIWMSQIRLNEIIKGTEKKVAGNISSLENTFRSQSDKLILLIFLLSIGSVLTIALVLYLGVKRFVTKPVNRIKNGLNVGAEQMSIAITQISSSNQVLADGTSEQAIAIEETSSSLEEMSTMTKQNADNASHADALMKESNQIVIKANTSMTKLTTSMGEISKASEEVSKIVKTIDEIAFQTNLLALNAAVEAARAGEAGAGFAVVADEVRNLAVRAADAARSTNELIEGTVNKVNEGGDLVTVTNDAFKEVADSASKVAELVGEIAAASNEQAEGIKQVNNAVIEMDKVVQQNTSNTKESVSASEQMNAQAKQMKRFVDDLVYLVSGGSISDDKHFINTEVDDSTTGPGKALTTTDSDLC